LSGIQLHLMRHGAPVQTGLMLGHADMPISEAGCSACFERGRRLHVAAIVSSDLKRARRPADLIAAWQDVPLHYDSRWRELDFGQWDGAAPADLPQAELAAFWDDPDRSAPPGGETWAGLCDRVSAALAEIDRSTLVVAHAGSIRAALSRLLGWDYRQSWSLALPYTALVSLTVWPASKRTAQITGLIA